MISMAQSKSNANANDISQPNDSNHHALLLPAAPLSHSSVLASSTDSASQAKNKNPKAQMGIKIFKRFILVVF